MTAAQVPAARPVFLDRDGTLIVEKHYLSDPAEVQLESGVVEGLTTLQTLGHPLIVLSNQSGIGRGKLTHEAALRVNARAAELLRESGVDVLAWYLCPHVPEMQCSCRKPRPGLAIDAARDWNLELRGSYVIGDKRTDLELADSIGAQGILVTSGHGGTALAWALGESRMIVGDFKSAADYIARRAANDSSAEIYR